MDEVEFLRTLRFTWTKIAQILGVSRATLYRRLEEEDVSPELWYSDISDHDLDTLIAAIKHEHPNDGERLMAGHLCSRGVFVPRARLRGSIHRVDPINTALRRSVTVRRRRYHAEGPNYIWHIDGHHKLIRWRLVIHGGIDGYSRTIVYLKCVDNNRASTVLSTFTGAVIDFGVPTRVRTDLGGENTDVWRFMIEHHDTDSSVITESSTHNERIERLWRDVFRCVGVIYYDAFRELEEQEMLDPMNDVDVYCLHYIFIPRINAALNSFIDSWNNHSLSSARNLTPNQLFVQGALEFNIIPEMVDHSAIRSQVQVLQHIASSRVEVPRVNFSPCMQLQHLMMQTNPLSPSVNLGVDLFMQLVNIVGQHLSNGCPDCSDS